MACRSSGVSPWSVPACVAVFVVSSCGRTDLLSSESMRDSARRRADSNGVPQVGGPNEWDEAASSSVGNNEVNAPRVPNREADDSDALEGGEALPDAVQPSACAHEPETVDSPTTRVTPEDFQALDLGGAMPDCRAAVAEPSARDSRFIAVRDIQASDGASEVYIAEMAESGPSALYPVGPSFTAWSVGQWSDDGRFFGFTTPNDGSPAPGEGRVVEVRTGEAPELLPIPSESGSFYDFEPGGSRFVTVQAGGIWIFDAAAPDLPPLELLPPDGFSGRLAWSPDGRYLGVEAEQLHLVEMKAPNLELSSIGPAGMYSRNVRWSPTGRRLAYTFVDGEAHPVLAYDLERPELGAFEVSSGLELVNSAEPSYSWFDDSRILIQDDADAFYVIDISLSPPTSTKVAELADHFVQILSGNRCVLASGPCASAGAEAVCVVSLDPETDNTPRPIAPGTGYWARWPRRASPILLVHASSHVIVQVALDGGPYAPRFVTEGEDYGRLDVNADVSPDAAWVYYSAAPSGSSSTKPHFWNSATEEVQVIEDGGLSYREVGLWSPDGRYFAIPARNPGFPISRAPLVIQRVGETALQERFELELFSNLNEFPFTEMAWQP